jgi:hypothetical protein
MTVSSTLSQSVTEAGSGKRTTGRPGVVATVVVAGPPADDDVGAVVAGAVTVGDVVGVVVGAVVGVVTVDAAAALADAASVAGAEPSPPEQAPASNAATTRVVPTDRRANRRGGVAATVGRLMARS